MLENRKILVAAIGYIIGIIMGLYCKISIVPFYVLFYIIYIFFINKKEKKKFKLFSIRRYFRYIKIVLNKKVIKIIVIFSIISNTIVLIQNYRYENLYKNMDGKNIILQGIVVDIQKDEYKVKIISEKYKNTYLKVYFKKKTNLEYGDKIFFNGDYKMPQKHSNYNGFDKLEYFKTLKIYGKVSAQKYKIISKNQANSIVKYIKILSQKISTKIEETQMNDNEKAILKAILLGNRQDISEETSEQFEKSNVSHILAVSGMHITYIIIIVNFIFNNIIGKHYSKIFTSLFILIYMCMAGFTPSIMRAGITGIIVIMANFFYRKSDIWESLGIAIFIILIDNPFSINSIGLKLSFSATIGILIMQKRFKKWIEMSIDIVNRRAIRKNKKRTIKLMKFLNSKLAKIIIDNIIITISATLMVIPIMAKYFNNIGFTSLIISVFISFLVGPIMVMGVIFLIVRIEIIEKILVFLIKILIQGTKLGSKLPLNQIYIITPNILQILVYYLSIIFVNLIIQINITKNHTVFQERIKNLISLIKYKLKSNLKNVISVILIAFFLLNIYIIIPKNMSMYFVDVGQGDCTLIVTPRNKSILIDGGGNEFSEYNIGKSTLMPYLLSRKIAVIDYIFISHFDTDHCQGLLYIMDKMKVRNVVIGRQYESNKNFEEFIKIVRKKQIKVITVEAGQRIKIEKNLYFDILWPYSEKRILENSINNNSLVCKMVNKNFSVLFTGDIESVAEKAILELYKEKQEILKADCLKVAHHGSKTSSTLEFLGAVSPKFSLIGVGKENKFGHPADITLENLKSMNINVYRTDINGEIIIKNDRWREKIIITE